MKLEKLDLLPRKPESTTVRCSVETKEYLEDVARDISKSQKVPKKQRLLVSARDVLDAIVKEHRERNELTK